MLSAATGKSILVNLTVEPLDWETPSLEAARKQRERRAAAITELRANTDVVALLDTFGGARLDESTIEPVEPNAIDAGDNQTEGDRA